MSRNIAGLKAVYNLREGMNYEALCGDGERAEQGDPDAAMNQNIDGLKTVFNLRNGMDSTAIRADVKAAEQGDPDAARRLHVAARFRPSRRPLHRLVRSFLSVPRTARVRRRGRGRRLGALRPNARAPGPLGRPARPRPSDLVPPSLVVA
jgi:hypothetical protein